MSFLSAVHKWQEYVGGHVRSHRQTDEYYSQQQNLWGAVDHKGNIEHCQRTVKQLVRHRLQAADTQAGSAHSLQQSASAQQNSQCTVKSDCTAGTQEQ